MLEKSHIPSVSGGEHHWFQRINLRLYDGDDDDYGYIAYYN
jgi:hypothetical protein